MIQIRLRPSIAFVVFFFLGFVNAFSVASFFRSQLMSAPVHDGERAIILGKTSLSHSTKRNQKGLHHEHFLFCFSRTNIVTLYKSQEAEQNEWRTEPEQPRDIKAQTTKQSRESHNSKPKSNKLERDTMRTTGQARIPREHFSQPKKKKKKEEKKRRHSFTNFFLITSN